MGQQRAGHKLSNTHSAFLPGVHNIGEETGNRRPLHNEIHLHPNKASFKLFRVHRRSSNSIWGRAEWDGKKLKKRHRGGRLWAHPMDKCKAMEGMTLEDMLGSGSMEWSSCWGQIADVGAVWVWGRVGDYWHQKWRPEVLSEEWRALYPMLRSWGFLGWAQTYKWTKFRS